MLNFIYKQNTRVVTKMLENYLVDYIVFETRKMFLLFLEEWSKKAEF